MTEPQDWIAVGPHGAYAACASEAKNLVPGFKRAAKRSGATVELVSREDAYQRMMEYRRRMDKAKAAFDAALVAP